MWQKGLAIAKIWQAKRRYLVWKRRKCLQLYQVFILIFYSQGMDNLQLNNEKHEKYMRKLL